MPSKHPKQKSSQQEDVRGILVDDEKDFAHQCAKKVASIVKGKQIGFSQFHNLSVSWKYRLSGAGLIVADIGADTYHVIPFYQSPQSIYWIGATLHIEHAFLKDYLAHISIIIIRGTTVHATQPLLRAEWDCRPSDPNTKHAQPHWHVYTYPLETTPAFKPFEVTLPIEEFTPEAANSQGSDGAVADWEAGEYFHYAMAAEWMKHGRGMGHDDWNADRALKWLEGCVSYIRDQFEYLAIKGKL
jgi:hypothetical protein